MVLVRSIVLLAISQLFSFSFMQYCLFTVFNRCLIDAGVIFLQLQMGASRTVFEHLQAVDTEWENAEKDYMSRIVSIDSSLCFCIYFFSFLSAFSLCRRNDRYRRTLRAHDAHYDANQRLFGKRVDFYSASGGVACL